MQYTSLKSLNYMHYLMLICHINSKICVFTENFIKKNCILNTTYLTEILCVESWTLHALNGGSYNDVVYAEKLLDSYKLTLYTRQKSALSA